MSKKKEKPAKTADPEPNNPLGLDGKGVAPLSIPELDKAINKYERKKDERCQASPGEIAAKGELTALLHANREQLPTNARGQRFYRYDDVDYIIEEKLKRQKVSGEDDEG